MLIILSKLIKYRNNNLVLFQHLSVCYGFDDNIGVLTPLTHYRVPLISQTAYPFYYLDLLLANREAYYAGKNQK